MGRVSRDTIKKLNDFINSLPEEAKSKCALCNETLTHIVKQAEVQTGAGTATVCRAIAEKVNEGAASGDMVTEKALQFRVVNNENGRRENIVAQCNNKETAKVNPDSITIDFRIDRATGDVYEDGKKKAVRYAGEAEYFVSLAMSQLTRIPSDDPSARKELKGLIEWCEHKIASLEV